MFLAVHAAVGAIAGSAVADHAAGAFILGVASHFFTDLIPHGDEAMYNGYKSGERVKRAILYVTVDAVATVALIAFFFAANDYFHPVSVAMGIAGGLLPDILVGLAELSRPQGTRWLSRRLKWVHQFHMRNHHFLIKHLRREERDIPLRYGLLMQFAALAVLIKIIV